MYLSTDERKAKLRIAAAKRGYADPLELLYHYLDHDIVPGICTNLDCTCMVPVLRESEHAHCPNCGTFTAVSVLKLAGTV